MCWEAGGRQELNGLSNKKQTQSNNNRLNRYALNIILIIVYTKYIIICYQDQPYYYHYYTHNRYVTTTMDVFTSSIISNYITIHHQLTIVCSSMTIWIVLPHPPVQRKFFRAVLYISIIRHMERGMCVTRGGGRETMVFHGITP